MNKTIVVVAALLAFSGLSFGAGSIIMPFWQDNGTPVYTMFILFNSSTTTSTQVAVMYYGKTGNPQAGTAIIRNIPQKNVEIFGTNNYAGELRVPTGDPLGYAIAMITSPGKFVATGIVYDGLAKAGYVIPVYQGETDGSATAGW